MRFGGKMGHSSLAENVRIWYAPGLEKAVKRIQYINKSEKSEKFLKIY